MILIVCAHPHDSTSFEIDNDSPQVNEKQQQLVKGPTRLRRSKWHPCYKTDNNGNPVITHTSKNTVNYECNLWTTRACGQVIPKYGYAKCAAVHKRIRSDVSVVVGCDCASVQRVSFVVKMVLQLINGVQQRKKKELFSRHFSVIQHLFLTFVVKA